MSVELSYGLTLPPTDATRAPAVVELGYGSDLRCAEDLLDTMDEVDPFSVLAIGEALFRRLTTPRGGLIDDPDYGLDVRGYLNRGTTTGGLRTMAAQIQSEVTKDDRVDAATVELRLPLPIGSTVLVSIRVTPHDPRRGGFSMTLVVTSAEVLLEEIAA